MLEPVISVFLFRKNGKSQRGARARIAAPAAQYAPLNRFGWEMVGKYGCLWLPPALSPACKRAMLLTGSIHEPMAKLCFCAYKFILH